MDDSQTLFKKSTFYNYISRFIPFNGKKIIINQQYTSSHLTYTILVQIKCYQDCIHKIFPENNDAIF